MPVISVSGRPQPGAAPGPLPGPGAATGTSSQWLGSFSSADVGRSSGGTWSQYTATALPNTTPRLNAVAAVPAGVYRLPLEHTLDAYVLRMDYDASVAVGSGQWMLGYPVAHQGKLSLRAANFHLSGVSLCAFAQR